MMVKERGQKENFYNISGESNLLNVYWPVHKKEIYCLRASFASHKIVVLIFLSDFLVWSSAMKKLRAFDKGCELYFGL